MPLVEEAWHSEHERILKIVDGRRVIYSIDYYVRLQSPPGTGELEEHLRLGPVTLYSLTLEGGCSAIILSTPKGYELISLRLTADLGEDPAGGSPLNAREICVKALESRGLLGGVP